MKIAVVTGGTKGIGKQIVLDLLNRGYFVWTNYSSDVDAARNANDEFRQLSSSFRIVKADQSDKKEFSAFVKTINQESTEINCIVANAGMTIRKPAMQLTDDDWEQMMQVIVNSHFYLVRDLYGKIARNSRIIFIGSMMGVLPHGTSLPYGVAKSALHALAKNLVKEFEDTGTTVNAIAPGFVETEWQKTKPEEIRQNIYKKTSVKRFATTEEISNAVMFCIENAFVNGTIIEVSGGYCFK